jgi:hypothetical protein
MSWFQTDAVLADERPRTAVADGVLLERRTLLRLSAATVAAGLATACAVPGGRKPAVAAPPPTSDGTLDIAEFLAEMYPRAQAFVASGGEREEAYLMAVGELMARLRTPSTDDARSAMRALSEQHRTDDRRFEMWVAMFAFEPGKGFSHHDHRDYNGVILGVEGETRVRNFDILGDDLVPPQGATFQIRQTRDDLILPGRFSTLGTVRDNVHEVVAGPAGAKVLDVFTYLESDSRSYSMDVDPRPVDAERGVYEASWA